MCTGDLKPQNRLLWNHCTTWRVFSSWPPGHWPPGHLASSAPPNHAEPRRTTPNQTKPQKNTHIFFLPIFGCRSPPIPAKPRQTPPNQQAALFWQQHVLVGTELNRTKPNQTKPNQHMPYLPKLMWKSLGMGASKGQPSPNPKKTDVAVRPRGVT